MCHMQHIRSLLRLSLQPKLVSDIHHALNVQMQCQTFQRIVHEKQNRVWLT